MCDVDVLVVGAGITGVYQLHRALEAGFTAALLEAGEGVGGTWFWNRYPGARFDSESYTYGYLFSRELWDEWRWSELFAGQPEIERYLNHVVDRFDLRRHMTFGATVTAAVWDDEAAEWRVTTADGTVRSTRFLVTTTGILSVPHIPELPGRNDFRGLQVHTGRWPAEGLELAGRRVAVVGTGSSGVQLVPAIADEVAALTVYQRTAHWCTPLNNRPLADDDHAWLRSDYEAIKHVLDTSPAGFLHEPHDRTAADDSAEEQRAFFERMYASPGFTKLTSSYTDLLFDGPANAAWCAFLADKVRQSVHDAAVAERLIPQDHRYGEHRPPFVTGYYETFNRPHVELVSTRDTPLVAMMPEGLQTTDALREHDLVVWATGFDFGTGALLRMGVRGRGGVPLTEAWADGPSTFLGVQAAGFPNLFFPGGPHAAAGNNPRYSGDQVDFVTDLLLAAKERGCDRVEVGAEAEERWTSMMDRAARRPPSFGERSYYFGSNIPGKPRRYLLNAAGRPKLRSLMAEVRADDYAAFGLSNR